jgi:uncharacterized protein YjbI with pentapeptide repeats
VFPPIPRWKIVTGVVMVVASTTAVVTVLWWAGTRGLTGTELVTARLDALRVGLSIAVGGGGVFALYLAWRRQRSTEADLDNRERAHALQEWVATASEADAEARRITDLYTKAIDQLGSDKAPVRLGGLYALERLAQDHEEQRQVIVNVLCAYLRMPYTLPGAPPAGDAPDQVHTEHRERVQEREVRLTAQRLLRTHLYLDPEQDHPAATFWADVDLDLTGAHLDSFNLFGCTLRTATFTATTFTGPTDFSATTFTDLAIFESAIFTGPAGFGASTFDIVARFGAVTFTGNVSFESATFTGTADFHSATFTSDVDFLSATFTSLATFRKSSFNGDALFNEATFTNDPDFTSTTFPPGGVPPQIEPFWTPPSNESAAGPEDQSD